MSSVQGIGAGRLGQVPGGARLHRPNVAANGPSFADTLRSALGEVQQSQDDAQEIIGQYLRGEPVELHRVMAATEEAGIALEMLVEVRNKITEAYRAVVQMQS